MTDLPHENKHHGQMNFALGVALALLITSLLLLVVRSVLDLDIVPELWPLPAHLPTILILLAYVVTGAIGIVTLTEHLRLRPLLRPRELTVLIGLCLAVTALGVWTFSGYAHAEQRILAHLDPLPAHLNYRASTEAGVFTGTLSKHDLTCGTLDTLITGGFDVLSPGFLITRINTTPGDAVVQTGSWAAKSLKTDPAAVQLIRNVPEYQRKWLWHRLNCPGTLLSELQSVRLSGTLQPAH